MLMCKNCYVNPVCKIFERNNELSSSIAISVDGCKYFCEEKYDKEYPQQSHDLNALMNRVNNLTEISRSREMLYNDYEDFDEIKRCQTCGNINEECVECSLCGDLVCPKCSVSTNDGKKMCEECYEYSLREER